MPGLPGRRKDTQLCNSQRQALLNWPGSKRTWVFSIVMNGKGTSKRVLDKIAKILAGHLAKAG